MESAAEFSTGRITTRCTSEPNNMPIRGTIRKASQKLPVIRMTVQANTVPTMKKSPCATLMMSSSPKMIDRPRAIRAMIRPQTSPFMARIKSRSDTTPSLANVSSDRVAPARRPGFSPNPALLGVPDPGSNTA
jgi:hypothetical protein